MTKAKVYFSDMRTRYGGLSLPQKLGKLIEAAGIGDIDFQNKFAAIKIHFGEPGNLSFLRPNYAKVVVDTVAAQGGRPFLTDCNTLYVGRRKHALEHITAAYENGFSPFSTGCHIIIADGLKGTDEAYVTVPGGELVQEAKIGKALMDADIVISLNHFKGHEATGFGGAIKNIGMGGGSRAGKMEMHHDGKPHISERKCIGCGACNSVCITCSCFNTVDTPYTENGKSGERRRTWTGCMNDDFTTVNGGHAFRDEYKDRMRFKTMHKVYDFKKRFATDYQMCVGCGRCDDICPSYISFTHIIQRLHDEVEHMKEEK